jgi:hypothetical protein
MRSDKKLLASLLNFNELKTWLHRDLTRQDKLLLVLSQFDEPCKLQEIRATAAEAGFRIPAAWNMSAILARSEGRAIRVPNGWEITAAGKQQLRNIGINKLSPAAVQVATDLRAHALKIANSDTRAFVEEAIKCHEAEFYRSAIVMSWLAAVDVLHQHVVSNHLGAFNREASRLDQKWKPAKTPDDLGRMGERDFLDRCVACSVFGKNVKDELEKALKLRNGCGHPNSLKVGPNVTAAHIEVLLLNVFTPFPV